MKEDLFYQNPHKTISLEYFLKECNSFEEFERRFPEDLLREDVRIANFVEDLLFKYDKRAAAVSKKAGLAFSYVGNITNGRKTNPSRNVLLSICLAIGTTYEEVQQVLRYAGHAPLYVRRRRDVVIWFGFLKHQDLQTVNDALIARGMQPLIRE